MLRIPAVMLTGLVLCACADVVPVGAPQMGVNEIQQKPGLFSGPEGDFVVVGPDNWSDPAEAEPEG